MQRYHYKIGLLCLRFGGNKRIHLHAVLQFLLKRKLPFRPLNPPARKASNHISTYFFGAKKEGKKHLQQFLAEFVAAITFIIEIQNSPPSYQRTGDYK